MQVRCGRRTFLKGATAGLALGPAVAFAATPELEIRQQWQTGNATLSPAAGDGVRLYFCGDRRAGAIDPSKAGFIWHVDLAEGLTFQFRPRVAGQHVVFSGQRGFAVHDAASGAQLWQRPAIIQCGVPLVTESQVILGDGHEVVALALASGEEQWRHAGVPETLMNYAPVQSGSTVLAAPGDGRLYALEAESGRLLWQQDGRERWQYLRQLRVHRGILVAGSYKEKLFGIDIRDGRELWQFNAGNFINSHHVADGAAYLWSPTGFIYAIDATTGAVLWQHETTDYDDNHKNWGPLMAELVTEGANLLALDMFNVLHVLRRADGTAVSHFRVPANIRHAVLPLGAVGLAFPTQSGDIVLTGPV